MKHQLNRPAVGAGAPVPCIIIGLVCAAPVVALCDDPVAVAAVALMLVRVLCRPGSDVVLTGLFRVAFAACSFVQIACVLPAVAPCVVLGHSPCADGAGALMLGGIQIYA